MSERGTPEKTWMTSNKSAIRPYQSETLSIDDVLLECIAGPHQGISWPLERELISVGRALWCDIVLTGDKKVSAHHCELQLGPDGIRAKDLGSSNGSFLNGVRIFDALLSTSTTLQIGDTQLALRPLHTRRDILVDYFDQSGLLVGKSPKMRKIFSMIARLGQVQEPILLLGETGTGKSSVARALHEQSNRSHGPFVTVNCGALSPALIESQLFGYEKGAFTGAQHTHKGFFEQAEGGTLFLDEIGELPAELQPKLLDVLERQCIRRLGSEQEVQVDFRLIAATLQDLRDAIRAKTFRQDLFYRIAVVTLEVPPLRERREDLPLLAAYVLASLRPEESMTLAPNAITKIQQHLWPGNVRELHNCLSSALVFLPEGAQVINVDDIDLYTDPDSPLLHNDDARQPVQALDTGLLTPGQGETLKDQLERVECAILQQTLDALDGDIPAAIDKLGLGRSSFYNRLKKYGIKVPR